MQLSRWNLFFLLDSFRNYTKLFIDNNNCSSNSSNCSTSFLSSARTRLGIHDCHHVDRISDFLSEILVFPKEVIEGPA